MDILPNEIESIKVIGNLHGDDVKMIKTFGGLHVAIGKKNKNSRKPEALAAASHAAIVSHQVSKDHNSFQPAIAKSEHERPEEVEDKSEFLSKSLKDKGIELFVLSKNDSLQFILYKSGLTIGKYETESVNGSLLIKSHKFNTDFYPTLKKEVSNSMAKAMNNKMSEKNLKKILVEL